MINANHLRTLQERKLTDVEAEYAALDLDVQLADIAGIDTDAVNQARAQLKILDVQHAALVAWLDRNGDPCPDS